MESEKHLAPLDSYSLSLSSIQDMRQSLAQFMDESSVSAAFEKSNRTGILLSQDALGEIKLVHKQVSVSGTASLSWAKLNQFTKVT